jgi:hypothetical protein
MYHESHPFISLLSAKFATINYIIATFSPK